MPESVVPLIAVGVVIVLFIVLLSVLTNNYSLNGIKSKTVGDGQHGTARWATTQEIKKSYASVPFDVASGKELAGGTGNDSRQYAARQAARRAGRLRRCALPYDRRVRRRQNCLFSVSKSRICLRQRHELCRA